MDYSDYMFKFTDLTQALQALQELRTSGIMGGENMPENMLGDPRDINGNIVSPTSDTLAFYGRKGTPAFQYQDPTTGETMDVPAQGDPNYWYVHIRSHVPPTQLTFDPTAYGLLPCDPVESATVLGVWA